jgi:Rad3-related DNA helicase
MRKVRQAIGRLVRTPQQQAHILLHCQRFAEDTFLQHLPPYLQPDSLIRTDEDLEQIWLNLTD